MLAAALVVRAVAAQAPPLPALPLDAYPQPMREAVAPLYATAQTRTGDAAAAGALGRALQAWDQFEDAHGVYQRAQALAPKALEWPYLDGVVLSRLARHDEAADQFRRALSLSPGYVPGQIKLAEALFRAGHAEQAKPLFVLLQSNTLTRPFAEYGLGQVAAAAGQHDLAVAHFERAIALFPEWGEAHYARALSYTRLGRHEDAERAMADRLRFGTLGPGLEDPVLATIATVRDDALAYLQRGIELDQHGDLPGAIAAHAAAVARDPSLAQAHLNLMLLYGRTQNWAKVEEHYRQAVALGFSLGDVHYNYGFAQQLQGRWPLAEASYRRALDASPQHLAARLNLALALEHRQALEEAAAELRRATEVDPTSRAARFYLGRVLLALGRAPAAILELERVIEPRDADASLYLHALAIAHLEAGNRGAAARHATTARELAVANRQTELVAIIDGTLALLKGSGP